MYTDEQIKVIEEDRSQSKQLNIYLLAGLLRILQSDTTDDIKKIVTETIKKGKSVYPEVFPDKENFN
ncbi:hypothetical protein [Clostridium kluyveri]|uniref:Uncharacterized protein n=1 Tax=Clostridium kluyveri TaxID=1534 RepID=A0A1L5F8T4_CLOKL|nr:hypothetical protein [Clostridium kluyveri]APM39383.1 hypothetical protein BS101_11845 [Clostridium kluyveri]